MDQWLLAPPTLAEGGSWSPKTTSGDFKPPETPAPQDQKPLSFVSHVHRNTPFKHS